MKRLRLLVDLGWLGLWSGLFVHFSVVMLKYGECELHYFYEGYALFCLAILTITCFRFVPRSSA